MESMWNLFSNDIPKYDHATAAKLVDEHRLKFLGAFRKMAEKLVFQQFSGSLIFTPWLLCLSQIIEIFYLKFVWLHLFI